MNHHRKSSFVDWDAWLPAIVVILAPAIATVAMFIVTLNWENLGFKMSQWWPVFIVAFFLFPAVVAFGVNWWHFASDSPFRALWLPLLAAVLQVLVIPLLLGFAAPDPDSDVDLGYDQNPAALIEAGIFVGLLLTLPTLLAGYLGTWLGHWSQD